MFKTYTMEQNAAAQAALRLAWDQGMLDPLVLYPEVLDWHPPEPDPCAARLLSEEPDPPPRNDRITDQLNEPAFDTRAQRYQDNSYFHTQFAADTAYEVARFVTAGNETGFVKLCWTYAEFQIGGVPPVVVLNPYDPFAVQRQMPPAFQVRWIARLHQGLFQRQVPAPYVGPLANIGGYGYSPLNQWEDYRFMWGRTQTNVFWLVPQGHALRLYFWISGFTNELTRVGGRLAGYTQPIDVRPTGWNVTHGF